MWIMKKTNLTVNHHSNFMWTQVSLDVNIIIEIQVLVYTQDNY